jgi:hypothetical protein
VIALAVTQHATVRKNSAFWHDKGGDGGLEWYKYKEDDDRELHEDPAAPDYRHTLGIEPKTWLSRSYQEVMTLDFDYRKLQLKPDKEGDPVLANHVQLYHQVRSSLFFAPLWLKSPLFCTWKFIGALDILLKVFQKSLGLNGVVCTKSW